MYNKLLMFIVMVVVISSGCFYEPVRVPRAEAGQTVVVRQLPRRISSAGYRSPGVWVHACEPIRQGHYVYTQCYWHRLNEYSRY